MTDRVDLDRLAEYVAGLLDGTPAADQIAHLVDTDGQWAAAHAGLRAADPLVAADLAALGAAPEPMPPDVVARLSEALAGQQRAPGRTAVVSLAARRRRKRWTAAAAVAAGVAALALCGVPVLRSDDTGDDVGGTSLNSGREQPQAPAAAPADSGVLVWASGRDYRRDTAWFPTAGGAQPDPGGQAVDGLSEQSRGQRIPSELLRLADPASRQICLAAITRLYGGRPQSVDYARFEGAPAVVVVLLDERGRPARAVVAGPDCGLGGQPDVRHTVPIG